MGGGEYVFPATQCVSPEQSEVIKGMLQKSISRLRAEGLLAPPNLGSHVLFSWPLRQSSLINDPSYYGISNFVDHDPTVQNKLKDYNCGSRTYDLSGGYNHRGVDIFTYPFAKYKQQMNYVEVIAAAPGTIIAKYDGNPDQNCAFCTSACNWNAMYIRHADGSVAWYGHLKSGSQNAKSVGASVAEGEFIGVVGSSGNSTGPHLHFEVYADEAQTQLIDPFAGACNSRNGNDSWWKNQKPYREPTINRIQTSNALPVDGTCGVSETTNEKDVFAFSETIYFVNFYHDQQAGVNSRYEILYPNGTVYQSWQHASNTTYNASWWYWFFPSLPAVEGFWKYRVTYLATGQQVTHTFYRGNNPPIFTVRHGDYNASDTWSTNAIPNPTDRIFVRHRVTVATNLSVKQVVVGEKGIWEAAPGVQVILNGN
jgi:murein DD-endopeptidase MepM/ murein hydrolase activator NlpD